MSMIAITLSAAALAGTPTTDFRLTVLHTNDTESKLLYPSSSQQAYGGVARFKTKVDQLRAAADAEGGVVMVSSGDNVLAGPEWNASLSLPAGSRYYDAVGLQAIGYDAICIGNHDFDFGPEILANLINGFTDGTPFLSSNLDVSPEPSLAALATAGRIRASVTTTTDGRTIGFVGATTTDLPFISTPGDVIVNTDVAARIQAQVDALTAKGVKYIVVMTHLQGISAERLLAQSLRNVDVLVAGGGDELLWNAGQLLVPDDAVDANSDGVPDIRYGAYPLYESDADGKQLPIITTRGDYRYVGRLVVDFDADGNVIAVDPTSGPVRVASTAQADGVIEDAAVKAAVTDPVAASVAGLAANVIAQSAVALDGRTSVIRTKETNEGNLCADSMLWQAQQLAVQEGLPLPVMSFQNGGGIRNNSILAAGNFTELNTFQILPFSNFVAIVPNVSMSTIKALLENAVSRVSPSPGYPSSGNGRFAQVGGFSFSYFVDTVPGQRVRDVVLEDGTVLFDEGVAVNPKATVAIATIDFLCRGGDEYPLNGLPFENLGVSYQQALFNYVTQGLGGQITAADYPTAGEGRIVRIDSPADFDNNSIVNGADLVVLLGQWGGPGSADLNGSGTVDGDDFAMFLATWTEPGIPE